MARILIVDDNKLLTENFREILEGAPGLEARVSTAMDGQSGVRLARNEGFDVALVDVKLPDGSGVDVVRALRETCPLGEVVLITGFATVDSAVAALKAGAFAFLLKSFRPEELLSTVEQACAKVQLKREREELQRRQRALIDTAGVLIVAVDREDRLVLFNPKVAEMTAQGIPAAQGRSVVLSWVSEDSRERVTSALRRAREGQPGVEVEAGFIDGGDFNPARRIHWHLSAVQNSDDQPGLVYGIGVDVTERRALERRAAEAEALSTMGTLALGLAHEIRNPLNAAVLQLHLLGRSIDRLDEGLRGQMKRRVTIVESEIGRLERLLTEFLELARPRGILIEAVELPRLVDAVVALEEETLALKNILLTQSLEPCAPAAGDPEKLKQVLLNLIANARDAMPSGGRLKLRVYGGEEPAIEVSDTGPGIEPAILDSVFDPFFTTKEAGTGLGLAIVRKILDQHRGQIEVDSTLGRGTRITLKLPRWRGSERLLSPADDRAAGHAGRHDRLGDR
ncbi:MAG: ATP-binding protein [Polyangiaceae bacterium]|jgi:PAS domain S-box-containing protein|nr:ATP-binding protein [Polyangiaceae bacterium]